MFPSKSLHQAMAAHHAEINALIQKNPWLIPATLAWNILPIVVIGHGFWKTQQLRMQLKIEREKTKQLAVTQVGTQLKTKIKTETSHHHCPPFMHQHVCRHFHQS